MAIRRKRTDLSLSLEVEIIQLVQEKKSPPDSVALSRQFPRL